MIPNFFIIGSKTERPSSNKTIFADGSADKTYRDGVDLELSHWIPNRTPERYRADTSTEICMKFVAGQSTDGWDLAINNHLDADGVLAVFVLVHAEFALRHRETIVRAAEMGDFWGYGERPAQILFQGLTLYMNQLREAKEDIRTIYERCFEKVIQLIEQPEQAVETKDGLAALQASLARVEAGEIKRVQVSERLVHYALPHALVAADLEKALRVPGFNEPLSDTVWLQPAVRCKFDPDAVHLVSAAAADGHYYDLWYPGYMWADTEQRWRAPGFGFAGSTNGYYYGHPALEAAVARLQEQEQAAGTWTLAKELSPFSTIPGRNYPVVLSFLNTASQPHPSSLTPQQVLAELLAAF
ncbi:DUF6687 family protein [Tumebacillus sp. BK434]|uniref:DUF6687 family protein n=1 Tax=Tumebacillus sp. BK434 TaxID=2512169 RepID=UPI0010530A41|nr:DUF6687 family protein [Tumebacillus sp. BK434]